MSEIIPAVLAKSVADLAEKVAAIPKEASIIHIDILERDIWSATGRPFEVHLMVREPEWLMEQWYNRGAKRIIVHKLSPEIVRYRGLVELGLAVEIHTLLAEAMPNFDKVDFVQLMSIAEIGAQGHPLDERIFDRIREVKEKFPNLTLSVDGGINILNYKKLEELGAGRLVVGSGFAELWTSQMKK